MYAVNRSALVAKIALAPCGLKGSKCAPETAARPQPMNTSSRPILSPTTQVCRLASGGMFLLAVIVAASMQNGWNAAAGGHEPGFRGSDHGA